MNRDDEIALMKLIPCILLSALISVCVCSELPAQGMETDFRHFSLEYTEEQGSRDGGKCSLQLHAPENQPAYAWFDCVQRQGRIKRDIGGQDIESLRNLLLSSDVYGGKFWGLDPRPMDGTLSTLKVNGPTGTAIIVINESFASGARRELKGQILAIFNSMKKELKEGNGGNRVGGKEEREGFRKGRSSLARRVNGVRLLTDHRIAREGEQDEIVIEWTLDYDGPRQPLTILMPSLIRSTSGQTVVYISAENKAGILRLTTVVSPHVLGEYYAFEEWFLTVPKGKKGRGKIRIATKKVKELFEKSWPGMFNDMPPVLMIQLGHHPFDRGERYALDAWTGELYSPLMDVELGSW